MVDQFLLEGVVNLGKLLPEILAFEKGLCSDQRAAGPEFFSLLTNAARSGVNSLPASAQSLVSPFRKPIFPQSSKIMDRSGRVACHPISDEEAETFHASGFDHSFREEEFPRHPQSCKYVTVHDLIIRCHSLLTPAFPVESGKGRSVRLVGCRLASPVRTVSCGIPASEITFHRTSTVVADEDDEGVVRDFQFVD